MTLLRLVKIIISGFILANASNLATAKVIYSSDFENGLPDNGDVSVSGGELVASEGLSSVGFGTATLLNNTVGGATTFTFTNLESHTSIDLSFVAALIDSWDGDNAQPFGQDFFNITVDGISIFSQTGAFFTPNLGQFSAAARDINLFGTEGYTDSIFNLAFANVAHTASTLTIAIFASGPGYQGGDDESFALDNFRISLNETIQTTATSVPVPASIWFMITALAGYLVATRRKSR